MSDSTSRPDRFELVVLLVVYVVPLSATVVFLALVGLPGLALALLAVEAVVTACVVAAKRPEGVRPGPVVVALGVVATVSATGAAVLLS